MASQQRPQQQRQQRGRAAGGSAQAPPSEGNQKLLIAVAIGVVLVLAAVAFFVARGGDSNSGLLQPATVEIVGTALPAMPEVGPIADASNDPTVGTVAPTIVGTDFEGDEVRIEPDGRAKAIYFVAHWCPHCQAEVPVVQSLIDDGQKPDGLDVYAISTAVDSSRGNFPPEAWLDSEEFTPQVLRDDSELTAYNSVGPAGFPFVVYLDSNHQVVARSAGTLDAARMQALWVAAAGG